MPETQDIYQQKLKTLTAAGPREWSFALWAGETVLPKPVGAQMMPPRAKDAGHIAAGFQVFPAGF